MQIRNGPSPRTLHIRSVSPVTVPLSIFLSLSSTPFLPTPFFTIRASRAFQIQHSTTLRHVLCTWIGLFLFTSGCKLCFLVLTTSHASAMPRRQPPAAQLVSLLLIAVMMRATKPDQLIRNGAGFLPLQSIISPLYHLSSNRKQSHHFILAFELGMGSSWLHLTRQSEMSRGPLLIRVFEGNICKNSNYGLHRIKTTPKTSAGTNNIADFDRSMRWSWRLA